MRPLAVSPREFFMVTWHDGLVKISDECAPFFHHGTRTGALVLHGFTASPQSVAPLAKHLVRQGLTVNAPLLPGHGTTWRHLDTMTWVDWFQCVHQQALSMQEHCDSVVVVGQSLGGALALRLAQEYPELVDGLVLINPATMIKDPRLKFLPILRRTIKAVPGVGGDIRSNDSAELCYSMTPLNALHSMLELFTEVRRDLSVVTAPMLLMRSAVDHVLPPESAQLVLDTVSSTYRREVTLPNSYHVATLDCDAPTVCAETTHFINNFGKDS